MDDAAYSKYALLTSEPRVLQSHRQQFRREISRPLKILRLPEYDGETGVFLMDLNA